MEATTMKICADKFVQYLESKNYNYTVLADEDDKAVVDFPYSGKSAKCFFTGDNGEYLSIYMVYESVPEDKYASALIACNEVNCKYKWVTAYLDEDRDILLHLDALLTPETSASETMEMLVRFVDIGDKVKPILMKAIYA